jgi:hypothetical protein
VPDERLADTPPPVVAAAVAAAPAEPTLWESSLWEPTAWELSFAAPAPFPCTVAAEADTEGTASSAGMDEILPIGIVIVVPPFRRSWKIKILFGRSPRFVESRTAFFQQKVI